MSTVQIACKVCNNPSSGLHYGVFTCSACKGFFSRQIRSKQGKTCLHEGKCKIKAYNKHSCASCRLKACLQVGMSVHAIKTGRYTLEQKLRVETELKHLEEKTKAKTRRSEELQARLQPNIPLGPKGETIEEIITTIVKAYELIPSNLFVSQEYLDSRVERYREQYHLKEQLFGRMPVLGGDLFDEIWSLTGLDIDDRFQFRDFYLNTLRRWTRTYVCFSKKIPGFRQLHMEDQFNLLKYNRFEFWFSGSYKGYYPEIDIASYPSGACYHKDELKKKYPANVNEILFDVAKSLRRTNLTREEHILTSTLILLFPDRAPLTDRTAVEALQLKLITCLEYLVSKRPTSRDRLRGLTQAFEMLTKIRGLAHVDDIELTKEGWHDTLRLEKTKVLEQEMENRLIPFEKHQHGMV